MAITSSSTTAIDVPTLVSQLMAVERRPIDKLNAKITSFESKISSFGTLSSLVSSFQSASKNISTTLQMLAATPSDTRILTASAGDLYAQRQPAGAGAEPDRCGPDQQHRGHRQWRGHHGHLRPWRHQRRNIDQWEI